MVGNLEVDSMARQHCIKIEHILSKSSWKGRLKVFFYSDTWKEGITKTRLIMLFQIMVKYPFIGRRMQRSQTKYHALYQFEYNRNFSYDEQSSNETIPNISALDRCRTYDTQRGTSKIYYIRQILWALIIKFY